MQNCKTYKKVEGRETEKDSDEVEEHTDYDDG